MSRCEVYHFTQRKTMGKLRVGFTICDFSIYDLIRREADVATTPRRRALYGNIPFARDGGGAVATPAPHYPLPTTHCFPREAERIPLLLSLPSTNHQLSPTNSNHKS